MSCKTFTALLKIYSKTSLAASHSFAHSDNKQSYWNKVKGWKGPLKASLIAGSIGATGDILAQYITAEDTQNELDLIRIVRMASFSSTIHGPFSYYWYNMLDWRMPQKTVVNFFAKLTANQIFLGPFTLACLFSWQFGWQGKADQLLDKLKSDWMPTLVTGWFFWIPAGSVNFLVVPLQYQVLFMSLCGMLWTAYLSSVAAKGPSSEVSAIVPKASLALATTRTS